MKRNILFIMVAGVATALLVGGMAVTGREPAATADHRPCEVWVVDQSDTREDGGGTLYIYPGERLAGREAGSVRPEVIDLGGAAQTLCREQTGSAPRRPHMFGVNAANTHVILSYVTTGHVLFMDGPARAPLACIDVGEQAHATFATPDSRYVVVANQNGKLFQRIRTDYGANTFTLEAEATINLATCTTPSGARCEDPELRPDNAPICPVIDSSSRLAFVTLRGGGLFVVDLTTTPMAIVAEYDRATIEPNGCLGAEAAGKMYINSGGGTPGNPYNAELYVFSLSGLATRATTANTPAPRLVSGHTSAAPADSHGGTLVGDGTYLWVGDRAANRIVIVDTRNDAVVGEIDLLAGAISGDPAPDLMFASPDGDRVFVTLRGPFPLTGNAPAVGNAVGGTPGLGIIRVDQNGRSGALEAVALINHIVSSGQRSDPHAIAVRLR